MNNKTKGRSGRPTVEHKRDILLSVMVNEHERNCIAERAILANRCISVYLRQMGLTGAIHVKEFNKDLLKFLAVLSNTASLLNQIAKKRNSFQDLDALERATLNVLAKDLAKLTEEIRETLK